MKKIMFLFIPLMGFIIIFGSRSYAQGESQDNTNGNGFEYVTVINYAGTDASYTATVYSNHRICLLNQSGTSYYRYVCAGSLEENNRCGQLEFTSGSTSVSLLNNGSVGSCICQTSNNNGVPVWNWSAVCTPSFHESYNPDMPVFTSWEDCYAYSMSGNVNYDNPVFSSAIPVPEMTVTYVGVGLSLPTNVNGVYVDCSVAENDAFYVQLQAKYSVADMVNVLLNDGVITYEYLDWYDGEAFDIYGLRDNVSSVHVTAQEFQDSWDDIIDGLANNSAFPIFSTNVPFWMSNPDAAKYVSAKNRYKDVLMRQAPMYGSRMELFARYYAIVDSEVYVGRWVHWNSVNPSNTEELGNQYQEDQPFPGYQNTSNDVNMPDNENTYTEMGETTNVNQNPYTQVVVNNNVPNYPDYPTVATYNHDNILVQFITTAKQLPNFFGDFGSFLTASFAFIPSYIWAVIGFGFMCSIVVMIIKVL